MNNRELSTVEQSMEILNRCTGTFNVVTISRIRGPINKKTIRQALDLIQGRHPRLNSRITGTLDDLRFEFVKNLKIPLRIVKNSDKTHWQEVILEELNNNIDSNKFLMRCIFICPENKKSSGYLITTVHHAIVDGLSSIQLHSEILTYCCRIIMSDAQITEVAGLPALPSHDELMPESMKGLRGEIKGLLFLLKYKFKLLWNQPQTLGFEKYVPTESRSTGFVHRQLDKELTGRLVRICRNENTTVQGALCAAMLITIAKKIRGEKKKNIGVVCQSFIDLRKHLKPMVGYENMGIVSSSVPSFHILGKNISFWKLACDVKHQIKAGLASDDAFSNMLMSKNIIEFYLSHPNKAPVTTAVTNVGQVKIPHTYGPLKLEEISFVVSQRAFAGVLLAVTTFQEKMLLNFIFSEPSISWKTINILADSVMACLVDVCRGL